MRAPTSTPALHSGRCSGGRCCRARTPRLPAVRGVGRKRGMARMPSSAMRCTTLAAGLGAGWTAHAGDGTGNGGGDLGLGKGQGVCYVRATMCAMCVL